MKKVILALAIVSVSFAACNNGEDKKVEAPVADSTVAPMVDTTKAPMVDTTKAPMADTSKKK